MQDNNLVITEEQKQEFYDAIEYDEDKAAAAAAIDFPKNVCTRQYYDADMVTYIVY